MQRPHRERNAAAKEFLFWELYSRKGIRTLHQSQGPSFQPLFGPVVCTESRRFHLRAV